MNADERDTGTGSEPPRPTLGTRDYGGGCAQEVIGFGALRGRRVVAMRPQATLAEVRGMCAEWPEPEKPEAGR